MPAVTVAAAPSLAEPAAASAEAGGEGTSLRERVIRGTAWIFLGGIGGQALRFGSNLVLAWLLMPEAFGLMATISGLLACLEAFSDVGVHASIVQQKREDRAYLNTAYTVQVIRGVALWLGACLIAWPVTVIMEMTNPTDPFVGLLMWMLPVAGLNPLLAGLSNTSMSVHVRRLALGRLTAVELAAQAAGIVLMVALALLTGSPWALLAGPVVTGALKLGASHTVLAIAPNRLAWDRDSLREIMSFGRWIFLSTALFILVKWSDRLLVATFIGLATAGVYHIATQLAEQMSEMISRVTRAVLFPEFSRVAREEPERMRSVYYRARLRLDAMAMPVIGAVLAAGTWLVDALYATEYVAAGWMLQVLSIKAGMFCMLTPCETCLFAMGHTRYGFYRNAGRAAWVLTGIPLGWTLGGVAGIVWAVALSEVPVLIVLWWAAHRERLLDPVLEFRAPGFMAIGAMLGWAFVRIVETLT